MTKDVLISVSGLQMGEEKPEQIEVISKGNFYQKNGYSYVFYDAVDRKSTRLNSSHHRIGVGGVWV